jgi:hypothetical protein
MSSTGTDIPKKSRCIKCLRYFLQGGRQQDISAYRIPGSLLQSKLSDMSLR